VDGSDEQDRAFRRSAGHEAGPSRQPHAIVMSARFRQATGSRECPTARRCARETIHRRNAGRPEMRARAGECVIASV